MGNESSFSHLCGNPTETGINSPTQAERESRNKYPKHKPKKKRTKPRSTSNTSNYQQIEEYKNSEDPNEYNTNDQDVSKLKKELKSSKNEVKRIITQYNLQMDSVNKRYSSLQSKYDNEFQEKKSLLQQLQVLHFITYNQP